MIDVDKKIKLLEKKRGDAIYKFCIKIQNGEFDKKSYDEILECHIAMNVHKSLVGKTKEEKPLIERLFGKQKENDIHY